MEILDLYDKDRQKMDETMVRGGTYLDERYHLVVHVCIFSKDGRMLIQKRRDSKDRWPGLWDVSVGGAAVTGDTSETAAERETLEELGVEIDLKGIRPHLSINFERGFDDIYLVEKELDIEALELPTEEVEAVQWAECDEIMEMIDEETFIHYKKTFIKMLFEMRHSYGTIYD